MLVYLGKRLLALLPTVLVPLIAVFVIIRLAPGDPAGQILGDQATPEQINALREQLGLNASLPAQFVSFIGNIFTLNFGDSLFLHQPVKDIIPSYAIVTFEIGIFSLIVGAALGVAIGCLASFRRNHPDGRIATGIGIIGISIPQFLIALFLVIVFAVNLGWFPVSGYVPWSDGIGPHLNSIVLPVLTLSFAEVGAVSRLTRSSILDVMHEPFVTTARSLGVRTIRINRRYILRTTGVQVLTVIGLLMATVLSGSVVVENIFGIPGMGRLLFDSVGRRDYNLIQGIVLVIGVFIILVNLLVDVLYGVVDPRVQYGKATN
jgi:peptide/nickel transport system permease protein